MEEEFSVISTSQLSPHHIQLNIIKIAAIATSNQCNKISRPPNQNKTMEEQMEANLTVPYGNTTNNGALRKRRNPAEILQTWAQETVEATAGNSVLTSVMSSKAYDEPLMDRPVWKDPERFVRECGKFKEQDWQAPTQKIGDIIGLSALYADVDDDGGKKADLVGAAAQFMLNVGIIATLLVTIQLNLIIRDAPVHPLVAQGAVFVEEKIWGRQILVGDGSDMLIVILQQLASLWLLISIRDILAFIIKSSKMYGALMYWCADFETRVWFSRTWCVQESEGKIKVLIRGFCRSLIPYVFLSRGPVIAIGLEVMQQSTLHKLDVQVEIAKRMITYRLARKAQDLKKTTDDTSVVIDADADADLEA
jgi:hypothetical protein